jgi:GDPmannose 4,6-dehydratase
MKKALIFGSRGQDGHLLWEYLKDRGYELAGFGVGVCDSHLSDCCKTHGAINICDRLQVERVISDFLPDEIYYLAAIHSSAEVAARETVAEFEKMLQVNFLSYLNVLGAVAKISRNSRVFFAASSHVFAGGGDAAQDERTPFNPESAYAITKVNGIWASRLFRQQGVFAATGILYTHESPLRSPEFLSKKVVHAILEIQRGERSELVLGGLKNEVDWGYASDYVRAMHTILQLDQPDDFVVATGVKHSVRDFVKAAFGMAGLDWKAYVREDATVLQRPSVLRVGDASKLTALSGWKPSVTFEEMIHELLKAEGVALV